MVSQIATYLLKSMLERTHNPSSFTHLGNPQSKTRRGNPQGQKFSGPFFFVTGPPGAGACWSRDLLRDDVLKERLPRDLSASWITAVPVSSGGKDAVLLCSRALVLPDSRRRHFLAFNLVGFD